MYSSWVSLFGVVEWIELNARNDIVKMTIQIDRVSSRIKLNAPTLTTQSEFIAFTNLDTHNSTFLYQAIHFAAENQYRLVIAGEYYASLICDLICMCE